MQKYNYGRKQLGFWLENRPFFAYFQRRRINNPFLSLVLDLKNSGVEIILILKVFIVHLLIRIKLLPDIWYKCELELAKKEAKEIYKILNS